MHILKQQLTEAKLLLTSTQAAAANQKAESASQLEQAKQESQQLQKRFNAEQKALLHRSDEIERLSVAVDLPELPLVSTHILVVHKLSCCCLIQYLTLDLCFVVQIQLITGEHLPMPLVVMYMMVLTDSWHETRVCRFLWRQSASEGSLHRSHQALCFIG